MTSDNCTNMRCDMGADEGLLSLWLLSSAAAARAAAESWSWTLHFYNRYRTALAGEEKGSDVTTQIVTVRR